MLSSFLRSSSAPPRSILSLRYLCALLFSCLSTTCGQLSEASSLCNGSCTGVCVGMRIPASLIHVCSCLSLAAYRCTSTAQGRACLRGVLPSEEASSAASRLSSLLLSVALRSMYTYTCVVAYVPLSTSMTVCVRVYVSVHVYMSVYALQTFTQIPRRGIFEWRQGRRSLRWEERSSFFFLFLIPQSSLSSSPLQISLSSTTPSDPACNVFSITEVSGKPLY